jgi:hypothetical protein
MRYAKLTLFVGLLVAQLALPATTNAAPVGATCGGFFGIPCDPGSFCNFPNGTCGRFDMLGTCAKIPQICTRIFKPVCGCNGKTYSNDCVRMAAGVSKAHDGRCAPAPYKAM